jgi:hypothetical protein
MSWEFAIARPDRGTQPDERVEAYLAALQSSSSNLHPRARLPIPRRLDPPYLAFETRELHGLLL